MKAQFIGVLFCTTLLSSMAFADQMGAPMHIRQDVIYVGPSLDSFPANRGDRATVLLAINDAVALIDAHDYAGAMKRMKELQAALPKPTASEFKDIDNLEGTITVKSHFTVY